MRIFLLSFLLSLSALAMQGADFTYLTFQTEDGSEYSVVASGLSISFQDGNLVASDGTSLPLTNLRKMYFSNASDISGQWYGDRLQSSGQVVGLLSLIV